MSHFTDDLPPASAAGRYFYKAVARVGPKCVSIYDGVTEYAIGVTMKHPLTHMLEQELQSHPDSDSPSPRPSFGQSSAIDPQTGIRRHVGYYVYETAEEAINAFVPSTAALFVAPRIVLKCAAWGHIQQTNSRKTGILATYIRPIQVIPVPLGAKASRITPRQLVSTKLKCAREMRERFVTSIKQNSRPFQRSDADSAALSHHLVLMEEELRNHVRSELDGRTIISEDFDYLITRAQNTGMRRYLSSIGVDVRSLLSKDPVYAEAGELAAAKTVASKIQRDEEKLALSATNAGFIATGPHSSRFNASGSIHNSPAPTYSPRPHAVSGAFVLGLPSHSEEDRFRQRSSR